MQKCVENYRLSFFGALWAQRKNPDFYRYWNAWGIVTQCFETILTEFFEKLQVESPFFL